MEGFNESKYKALRIIISCKKWIIHAQNIPLVSNNDLAKTKPKILAIVAPIIPLGIPAKWGIPNNMAETIKILMGERIPFRGDTIPNR